MSSRLKHSKQVCSLLFFGTLLCLWLPIEAETQTGRSILSGKITNATGTNLTNAHLSLKNTAEGTVQKVTANPDGSFAVRNLRPGTYEITASAPGFADAKTTVAIEAGIDQTVNFVMQIGTANETGNAEGGSSAVSGVVGAKSVRELPLNGRSATDLATLEPGVASARTQTVGQAQRGFGNQMTISGGRPRQNDSRLDGISVNDYANGPPVRSILRRNYRGFHAVRNQ